jgi:hypothetical protein
VVTLVVVQHIGVEIPCFGLCEGKQSVSIVCPSKAVVVASASVQLKGG